jgi:hypothetical protein
MRQQCISEELISNKSMIDDLYTKAYINHEIVTNKEQQFLLDAMENSTKLLHYIQDIYMRTNGRYIHPSDTTKGDQIGDQKSDPKGELIIVTSEWVTALKLIGLMIHCPMVKTKYLPTNFKAPKLFMYHGGMNSAQKQLVLKASEKCARDGIPSVLLLSFHSGAVGLNLFFSRSIMILEGWWNKALMEQMASRVHRNGQTKDCDIHQYIIEGTIEQHILWLQDEKHFKAMAVYGNEKERLHAKAQCDKRKPTKKGFQVKDAVKNMKKIRESYAEKTQNHSLLHKGFRSRIEIIKPEQDVRQTHTIQNLSTPKRKRETEDDIKEKRRLHTLAQQQVKDQINSNKKARPLHSKIILYDPSTSEQPPPQPPQQPQPPQPPQQQPNYTEVPHHNPSNSTIWNLASNVINSVTNVWKSF